MSFKTKLKRRRNRKSSYNKKNIYRDNLKYAKINNYLFDIIESLKNNYYIALVTTASKQNSEEILEFFNKKEVFELFIFAENVEKKKPDPEGFIKAMEYFNISPENTLIFEDSDIGIKAAQRSGANIMKIEKF
ncbi:HAD family hydrolase [Leptotrichia sp. oral taxon 212]|uniref:HAD family hydrolase n=1 Tax=Leptotrichia sp. oral taxon 212 TaxID=712357 RepID=UPI0035275148